MKIDGVKIQAKILGNRDKPNQGNVGGRNEQILRLYNALRPYYKSKA